ncbi:MAG: lipase family protein [Acidaminococcus sp.]|jgi:pimeloyl-ACP methyl ester carboxylesterase|nr:lipase family protein [Acidaminococcus sp.]MCI2100835.1 lipase family protein [Acidaminococcus sp.]MCI2115198.1 lipase family protein [Acidaminococcus sp.]MCI2117273.1 lipase family protein [Acidaminococcus sp.]
MKHIQQSKKYISTKALSMTLGLLLFSGMWGSTVPALAAAKAQSQPAAASATSKEAPSASETAVKTSQELRKEVQKAAVTAAAASLCSGTYKNGSGSQEHELFTDYGWKVTPYSSRDGKTVVHFDVAVGDKPIHGIKPTILAVRGSQSQGDWKLNLQTDQVPFAAADSGKNPRKDKSVPAVHEGFDTYAKTILKAPIDIDGDGLPDDLPAYLKKHPERRLLLTGHSLGGAAATLLGERLAEQGVSKEQIPVITFGAPAVGNKAFADTYGNKIDILRVVTSLDPVPGSLQTFVGGGYTQFGTLQKYALSEKYTSYQHPVSFYYDLAVRHFYDAWDAAIAAGAMKYPPDERRTEGKPLVALAVYARNKGFDDRFSPDLGRFLMDEYKALLPSYVVIDKGVIPGNEFQEPTQLGEKAQAAGASYLVVATVDQKRIGQTRQWYLTVTQHIRSLKGENFSTATMGSANVSFDRGVVQATLSLLEDQKRQMQELLPFVTEQRALWVQDEGESNENH